MYNFFVFATSFSGRKKLAKKITHLTTQFCSNNFTYFTNLSSLDLENSMLPQRCRKPFWVYKFSANMFLFVVRKKHLHCIVSWRPKSAFLKHFERKWLYISVYSVRKFFFQRCNKILSDGGGLGRAWIIFLRLLTVWTS